MFNLSKAAKLTRVSNAVAAGTTDIECTSVDMKGYNSVTFIAMFGTITSGAVTSCHVETSSDNSSFNDLAGTSVTVADDDDNQCVMLEVGHPLERYLRLVIDRGTQNAVLDGALALQHGAKTEPVTHDTSTVVGSEFHASPAEGTV